MKDGIRFKTMAQNYTKQKSQCMSRVEQIEGEIRRMSSQELALFRAWFAEFDADSWDLQFEADVKSGKLDTIAAVALRDHESGRSTEL